MKTFEQKFYDLIDMTDGSVVINEAVYKQIQLDAMKEGMRRAASKLYDGDEELGLWKEAILTTAKQLTEKEL
jgi:myo-inositol-hexaphosphate 3-phosphohydrolase